MKSSLKQAGEQRKDGNQIFQTSVSDARATTNVLKKAQARMKEFYAFAQVRSHVQEQITSENGTAAPPSKPADYQKSGGGKGVVALLREIIEEAQMEEQELVKAEG